MSQSAVDSKYCKREIGLANAVEEPILTIVLEHVDLPYGLKFLSLLPQINVNEREFDLLVTKGVRKHLAAAGIAP